MTRRTDRVGGLLRQEISRLLTQQLKDPRLGVLVSVTQVEMSPDLQYASVGISVMGEPEQQREALKGMESASGFLRRELRHRLRLKYVPHLRFALDTSLQEGDRLLSVMDRVRTEEVHPDV